jgi:hypothetical protein
MKGQTDSKAFPTGELLKPRLKSSVAVPAASKGVRLNAKTDRQIGQLKNPAQIPICATLVGSGRCAAFGVTGCGSAPILALCRALVAAGHDPHRPLHVYRDGSLALVVRSIGEGALLRIATHGVGFERIPKCTGGPPARQIAPTRVRPGPAHKRVYAATRNGKFHLSGKRRRR